MTWRLMWLNKSEATLNTTLQLLVLINIDFVIAVCSSVAKWICWLKNQSLLCKVGFHKYLIL